MKVRKTMLRYFAVGDWQKEEEFLRQQHGMGWKLLKSNVMSLYTFERCQPEDAIYQLDYNPEEAEHKAQYIGMYGDFGWEYVQELMGFSYFRKPVSEMNGREETLGDDNSRLEMMKRLMRGRISPLLIIFFCILLPQFILNLSLAIGGSKLSIAFAITFLMLIILYSWVLGKFWFSYRKIRDNCIKGQ